jgi:hypothetical protein
MKTLYMMITARKFMNLGKLKKIQKLQFRPCHQQVDHMLIILNQKKMINGAKI